MSYTLFLKDPVTKEIILLDTPHQMKGGTFPVGGTLEASINITYNYASCFIKAFSEERGVRSLYGMSGAESIPVLAHAIANLADDVDENYWTPTEGNAKQALYQLLALAQMRPDGIWDGD